MQNGVPTFGEILRALIENQDKAYDMLGAMRDNCMQEQKESFNLLRGQIQKSCSELRKLNADMPEWQDEEQYPISGKYCNWLQLEED